MRILHSIALIILLSSPLSGSSVTDSVTFRSLPPYYFHLDYLKEDKAILIDVREFFEFRRTRIKDAVNIPSTRSFQIPADTIDKACALFLYCTTGYRSTRAARYFSEHGFTKVYSLDGGIIAWKKDGFPVIRKKIKRR
jgi:rhodanese-related sulfurtransferase